jgi:hypothetical protein
MSPRKRLPSMVLPLGIGAALAIALAPGCTTHGEGGRCDPSNVNPAGGFADCDATNSNGVPLVCTSGAVLALPEGGTVSGYVCCPGPNDRAKATTDICRGNPVAPGSDASIPDTGADATSDQSTSDVTSDAPGDVTTDSPSDVTTDAPSDAPVD